MSDAITLFEERENIRQSLNETIIERRQKGRKLAYAENNYKRCRTLHMHRLMLEGYEGTKPIAATAVYDFVQGIEEVAKYRLERDILKADLDALDEIVNIRKLELRIVEADISAERLGK